MDMSPCCCYISLKMFLAYYKIKILFDKFTWKNVGDLTSSLGKMSTWDDVCIEASRGRICSCEETFAGVLLRCSGTGKQFLTLPLCNFCQISPILLINYMISALVIYVFFQINKNAL